MIAVSIVVIILGLVIMYVGKKVEQSGKTSFIAGNNEWFVPKYEKKLAERIGFVLILFGLETVLFPIVLQLVKGVEGYYFAIVALFHIFIVFALMIIDQITT